MRVLGTLALIGVSSACSDSTEPEAGPQTLAIVSGNAQTAPVDQALADPLVVRITQDGAAVSGTSVSWGVTAGGGSASPSTSVTDAAGQTSTTWTMGSAEGANTLEASASGPVPLEDDGYRARDGVVERHLPNEHAGRDLDLSLDDLERDVHDSGRTARHLFVDGQKRRVDQLLGHGLCVREREVHDGRIGRDFPSVRIALTTSDRSEHEEAKNGVREAVPTVVEGP